MATVAARPMVKALAIAAFLAANSAVTSLGTVINNLEDATSPVVVPGITASPVTGPGLVLTRGGGVLSATGWQGSGSPDYFVFTLKATAGPAQLFRISVDVSNNGDSGPTSWSFGTSTTTLYTYTPLDAASGHLEYTLTPAESLSSGGTEFRIYGYGGITGNNDIGFINNLTVEVVPEPANIALAAFGCVFAVGMFGRKYIKSRQ